MKLAATLSLFLLPCIRAFAFAPSRPSVVSSRNLAAEAPLFSSSTDDEFNTNSASASDDGSALSRRAVLSQTLATASFLALSPLYANADDAPTTKPPIVVVAGSTGQTGRRILERVSSLPNTSVIAGVRDVGKATKSLSESSTVVRGAMVQKVPSLDAAGVELRRLDVVQDSVEDLAETLKGADSLIIAVGFIPSNPLKMNAAAHSVDNLGTIKLIDAAKLAGIKKVVMVSSILTNARNWGQEKSPGFIVTNAFGNVLDEKLMAENYLKASGLDYTIVRPGGLKAKPPVGELKISGEDTLVGGEISRDLVADVCVASLTDAKAKNKVLEIIEDEEKEAKVFNGLVM